VLPGITELHPVKKISDHLRHRQRAHRFRSKTEICKLIGIKLTGLILQLTGGHPPGKKLEVGDNATDKEQQKNVGAGATT